MSKLNWETAKRKELKSSNPRPKSTLQQKLDKALEQGAKRERARITRLLEFRLAEYQNLDLQVSVATLADAIKFIQPPKTDLLE